ncbi:hypothetical protein J4217_01865 [Candidatus Pacearchaeota archaeon]|nr:hypothetical protein [Candidatus Pacearchaeota archaeon]
MDRLGKKLAGLIGGTALAILSGCAIVPERVVYSRPRIITEIYEVRGPACYGSVIILPEYRIRHNDWHFHPRPQFYQRPHIYQPAPRWNFQQMPRNQPHYRQPNAPNRPNMPNRPMPNRPNNPQRPSRQPNNPEKFLPPPGQR